MLGRVLLVGALLLAVGLPEPRDVTLGLPQSMIIIGVVGQRGEGVCLKAVDEYLLVSFILILDGQVGVHPGYLHAKDTVSSH